MENVGKFFLTTTSIPSEEFAKLLRPRVKKRRVFLFNMPGYRQCVCARSLTDAGVGQ